jgi:esterase
MPLQLHVTEHGAGPPVVLMHGLFGSSRNLATVAKHLAARHLVLAVDLRNHGASPWSHSMDYPAMAEDLVALIEARGLGPVALLGHSMGGKVAMLTALRRTDLVERLIVVDVAPLAYEPVLLSYVRAMRGADLAGVRRRAEVDAQLAEAVPDPADRGFLLQNLVLEDDGARWRINLPVLEQDLPTISGFPELPSNLIYEGPTLFVAGDRSDYIRAEHEPIIRGRFPRAKIVRIAGAGHWVHAEQPKAFLEAIGAFL